MHAPPTPSSRTVTVSAELSSTTRSHTQVARACLTALVTASAQT
jgi:hypothetical protein